MVDLNSTISAHEVNILELADDPENGFPKGNANGEMNDALKRFYWTFTTSLMKHRLPVESFGSKLNGPTFVYICQAKEVEQDTENTWNANTAKNGELGGRIVVGFEHRNIVLGRPAVPNPC